MRPLCICTQTLEARSELMMQVQLSWTNDRRSAIIDKSCFEYVSRNKSVWHLHVNLAIVIWQL
jgi:hypothetical protein